MGCNQVFDFSTADDSSRPSRLAGKRQLQPEVAPQVSHLEQEPLRKLAAEGKMAAYKHEGFWQPMDTLQEFTLLNKLWQEGRAPWKVW